MSKQGIFDLIFASKSAMCDQASVSKIVSTVCIKKGPLCDEPEKTVLELVPREGLEPPTN